MILVNSTSLVLIKLLLSISGPLGINGFKQHFVCRYIEFSIVHYYILQAHLHKPDTILQRETYVLRMFALVWFSARHKLV